MHLHHISIRTADIFKAIAFYEKLGFTMAERFTTGSTLACWLEGLSTRLELLQVPNPRPAPDCFGDPTYVGYYHISLHVPSIDHTLAKLGQVQLLLPPIQQHIGDKTYRVAFIADCDGLPIELLESQTETNSIPKSLGS